MNKSFLILIFLILSSELFAQSFYNYKRGRNAVISAGTGTSTYLGDLQNKGDYLDFSPNFVVGLQYQFTGRIAARAEVQWFQLAGDDKNSDDEDLVRRNLSFISNNFELNVVGMVNLFENGTRYYQRPSFNLYGYAGLGLLYFNPKAELNGEKYALQPIKTEGVSYSRSTIALIYGLGARFKVNPFFNLVIEGGLRQTFTDYLDDVSSKYVDNTSFSDPAHAILADRRVELGFEPKNAGSTRGNPDRNDGYFLLNVKVEFYLPADMLSIGSNKKPGNNRYKKRRR